MSSGQKSLFLGLFSPFLGKKPIHPSKTIPDFLSEIQSRVNKSAKFFIRFLNLSTSQSILSIQSANLKLFGFHSKKYVKVHSEIWLQSFSWMPNELKMSTVVLLPISCWNERHREIYLTLGKWHFSGLLWLRAAVSNEIYTAFDNFIDY